MQKKAVVCVTNDLTTDQRVHKTCLTLQKCGYYVIEFGRLLPESVPLKRSYLTIRKKMWFRNGPLFYIEYNIRLFIYLVFSRVDLILSNDVDTLPAAYFASKIRNKKLIFDAHELFSELPELVNRQRIKWIWQQVENYLLPRLSNTITVCQSIADYYKQKYNISFQVVRNVPLYRQLKKTDKLLFPNKKIILYQGAINIGRGLEWVIEAMQQIDNAVLVIIGNGDIKGKLENKVHELKIDEKVIFLGTINADSLWEYTASADLGLCLLEQKGLNYYYALPNRIFDYIQAGTPVLATRFPEITKIVEPYQTGMLVEHYEPDYLAKTISTMLRSPIDTRHFESLAKEFCWENEEKILISIIRKEENSK